MEQRKGFFATMVHTERQQFHCRDLGWYRRLSTNNVRLLVLLVSAVSFKLFGLWSLAQYPDLPSFKSLHTDLLNPWAAWCGQTNHVIIQCQGTGWNHFGGPYSILWYWTMIAIGLGGNVSFTMGLFVIDQIYTLFLYFWKKWLLIPYVVTSTIYLVFYPQNMIILFLQVFAFWNLAFIPLAIIFKLPIGAPISVWSFMWTSPTSLHDPINFGSYAVLILWCIAPIVWRIRRTKIKAWIQNSRLHYKIILKPSSE